MNLLSKDQLNIISHDLNSDWTCIHGAVHLLNETNLSISERLLYEDMLTRNTASLQVNLAKLIGYLTLDTLIATMSGLLSKLRLQNSLHIMAQLEPLFLELKGIIKVALV